LDTAAAAKFLAPRDDFRLTSQPQTGSVTFSCKKIRSPGAFRMEANHALGISRLHHVSLSVPNLEKSLAFYRDVMGLRVKTAFTLDGMRFVMLEIAAGSYLELIEVKKAVRPGGMFEDAMGHLALRTDALEKALDAATQAGCEILLPIRPLDLTNDITGKRLPLRVAFFRGPDGEIVELLEDSTRQT
jgi:glyoxylase I family protein